MFQIFGSIAQFERDQPVENPDGRGKKLKLIPSESDHVKRMFDWYLYENLGDEQIANRLNDEGVPLGKYSRTKSKQAS